MTPPIEIAELALPDLRAWGAATGVTALPTSAEAGPARLRRAEVWVGVDAVPSGACERHLPPLVRRDGAWTVAAWPSEADLTLDLRFAAGAVRGRAQLTFGAGDERVVRLFLWPNWAVDAVTADGRPLPYLRDGADLLVAVPRRGERPTIEVAFSGDGAGRGVDLDPTALGLVSVALPWAATLRTVELTVSPVPEGWETVASVDVTRDATALHARWDDRASTWALQARPELARLERDGVAVSTPPPLALHHERLWMRVAAAVSAAEAAGLVVREPLQITLGTAPFRSTDP